MFFVIPQVCWMDDCFASTMSSPWFLSVLHETSLRSNLVKASVLWPIMSHLLYNTLFIILWSTYGLTSVLFSCPWLSFGNWLLWLVSCYCFTLINEHDENIYDTLMISRWMTTWENNTTMRVEWDALSWLIRWTWGCNWLRRCAVNGGRA